MNDYPPSLTSGESACDINLPDVPTKRQELEGRLVVVARWLEQPPTENPWSSWDLTGSQAYELSETVIKLINSYGLVGDPPKAYIVEPVPFVSTTPSLPYVGSTGKSKDRVATDASHIRAVNGSSEPPGQTVTTKGSMPLKSTEEAKMNVIGLKMINVSDNQLLVFLMRRLDETDKISTTGRLRAALLCCSSDLPSIETFGSSFITRVREHKVNNLSSLLIELVIPLARSWNKPCIYMGLSTKPSRHSEEFMVLFRTSTLLTHKLRPEWDTQWHIHQRYWSVSRLTSYTVDGAESPTGSNESRPLEGTSRGLMNTTGKRRAWSPSGSANNGKRLKISADGLPGAPNNHRLACPFSKHNPVRYRNVYGACTFPPGFLDIKNFMEHLKRCHAPPRCQTCKIRFHGSATDAIRARDAHRASSTCTLQTELNHEPEWMTERQEGVFTLELVQRTLRKPRIDPVDKWNFVYRYLFDIPASTEIPNPFYDYYIARHELVELEISRVQPEPLPPNVESPSVIEEDSTALEPSASTSAQGFQGQPLVINSDAWSSNALEGIPVASSPLLAPPESQHIDREQFASRIASRHHQVGSSPQLEPSNGVHLRETELLSDIHSSTAPILSGPDSGSNTEDWRSHLSDTFDAVHQPNASSRTSWDCHRPDPQFTVPGRLGFSLDTPVPLAYGDLHSQRRININELAASALLHDEFYPNSFGDLEGLYSKAPDETTDGDHDISLLGLGGDTTN